jgi:hypothetical protein
MRDRFKAQNASWLNLEFRRAQYVYLRTNMFLASQKSVPPGRPRKLFMDTSEKLKKRKTGRIGEQDSPDEIALLFRSVLKNWPNRCGQVNQECLLKIVTHDTYIISSTDVKECSNEACS